MNDSDTKAVRPFCFMVMPFKRKAVRNGADNAPTEVNFDALWDKALSPAIQAAGYVPIRADADGGSVIIKDMFERLAFADLIIADVSIPNGNVYYEVGIRHAARETGCILISADWSRQLFDIDQFRSLRYPLTASEPTADDCRSIANILREGVPSLRGGRTPYHEFTGDGSAINDTARGVFRDRARQLRAFQDDVTAVRLADEDDRAERTRVLLDRYKASLDSAEVSVELLGLIRDALGWEEVLTFVESLPEEKRSLPYVREQTWLAKSKSGEPELAIAGLKGLIAEHGETPERYGLIGGRYKRLWRDARDKRVKIGDATPSLTEKRHLNAAIEHYQRGMALDLNDYYCSSNLPQLLMTRGERDDAERAARIDHLVIEACERAIAHDAADEWVGPTLLGAAFRSADTEKADELADRIELQGAAPWKLDSTINDLADTVAAVADPDVRATLESTLARLRALV